MTLVGIQDPIKGDWTLNLKYWNIIFDSLKVKFTELQKFAKDNLYEVYTNARKFPGPGLNAHHMFSKFRGLLPEYKGSDESANIVYLDDRLHAFVHGLNTVLFEEPEHIYAANFMLNMESKNISISSLDVFMGKSNIDFDPHYEQIKVDTFFFLFL